MEKELIAVEKDGNHVTLRVEVSELRIEMREDFHREMHDGMETGTGSVTFDLTKLQRIFSLFLGLLMDGVWTAKKEGRAVKLVAGPEIYKRLGDAGINNAVELECREGS